MKKEIAILAAIMAVVIGGLVVFSGAYRKSVQEERKPTNTAPAAAPAGQLVRADSPTLGPADAKVTLVEFYDPECEACAAFAPTVKKIMKDYDGKIRLVARYMPLHPNSMTAANFIEAAAEQGKYWEAQEILFEKQGEWGTKHGPPTAAPPPDIQKLFNGYAKEIGVDIDKALKAINEKTFTAKIEQDRKDGIGLGVRRTPQFFVNGRELARFGEPDLRALIEEEMKK